MKQRFLLPVFSIILLLLLVIGLAPLIPIHAAPPVDANRSTITANPTSLYADGKAIATITITVIGGNGKPISGKSVALSAAPATGVTIWPSNTETSNASGQVAFQVSSTSAAQ